MLVCNSQTNSESDSLRSYKAISEIFHLPFQNGNFFMRSPSNILDKPEALLCSILTKVLCNKMIYNATTQTFRYQGVLEGVSHQPKIFAPENIFVPSTRKLTHPIKLLFLIKKGIPPLNNSFHVKYFTFTCGHCCRTIFILNFKIIILQIHVIFLYKLVM